MTDTLAVDRTAELNATAERVFGWKSLRPEQIEAIAALLDGRDVLAVLRTGSGKSAIYQVPGAMNDGLTVVISPLIALQQDQIAGLEGSDAPRAVALHSRHRKRDVDDAWRAIDGGEATFVFLSPEQLAKDDVVGRLARAGVSLIAVDEAHCLSAWGHDFRPDYVRIPDAIGRLGRPPVVALTATASPLLRDEIVDLLGLVDPCVVTGDFDRPNIHLDVRHHTDDGDKRAAVVDTTAGLTGPGLVYCATRRDTEDYAGELRERGVDAVAYHAGLRSAERDDVHRRFHDDEVSVVVATSAFGMGIDKPNVRFVVHASVPDSVDSYYQQIGRAGRDGEPADAVLFYRQEDLGLGRFFATTHVDEDAVHAVYEALRSDRPIRLRDLRTRCGHGGRTVTQAVNLLQQAGVVTSGRRGLTRTDDDVEEALRRATEAAETAERVDRTRVEMLRAYAETDRCRRRQLLAYFGTHLDAPCGNCDTCERGAADRGESAIPVDTRVEHREWGPGLVIDGDDDRITVLFSEYGYRTLSMDAVREHGLLS
ncbi:MAG: ATP-dependent helicase, RecQ family [Mycobacterium sp.]|nr:ATP-dependent helicase, RecQ family [Mycobacterium sp.]